MVVLNGYFPLSPRLNDIRPAGKLDKWWRTQDPWGASVQLLTVDGQSCKGGGQVGGGEGPPLKLVAVAVTLFDGGGGARTRQFGEELATAANWSPSFLHNRLDVCVSAYFLTLQNVARVAQFIKRKLANASLVMVTVLAW